MSRATCNLPRDQLGDAMQRHRVHGGEMHSHHVDAWITRSTPRRTRFDVDQMRHVREVAAQAHPARELRRRRFAGT